VNLLERLVTKFEMFEMATNVRPEDTGLDRVIWISTSDQGGSHSYRIKVQKDAGYKVNKSTWITVTFDKNGIKKILHGKLDSKTERDIKKFIEYNNDLLISYWNDEISSKQILNQLKKI